LNYISDLVEEMQIPIQVVCYSIKNF